jgi:hypothetical protein
MLLQRPVLAVLLATSAVLKALATAIAMLQMGVR